MEGSKMTKEELVEFAISKQHPADQKMYREYQTTHPNLFMKICAWEWMLEFHPDKEDDWYSLLCRRHYGACMDQAHLCKKDYRQDVKFLQALDYPGDIPEWESAQGR